MPSRRISWIYLSPYAELVNLCDVLSYGTHEQSVAIFMVTPCINNIKHFIVQLTHTCKKVELLKHIKIMDAAPTCFGLQRNHHQGATAST